VKTLGKHPEVGRSPVEELPVEFAEWVIEFGVGRMSLCNRYDGTQVVILAVRHGAKRDTEFAHQSSGNCCLFTQNNCCCFRLKRNPALRGRLLFYFIDLADYSSARQPQVFDPAKGSMTRSLACVQQFGRRRSVMQRETGG